jgi:WhiB family redox-sensing transcriptional regulator
MTMQISDETAQRVRWQNQAECRRDVPEAYFSAATQASKQKCLRQCPVREQCLEYALEHNLIGIWGGTSAKERRRIKAERRQASRAQIVA